VSEKSPDVIVSDIGMPEKMDRDDARAACPLGAKRENPASR